MRPWLSPRQHGRFRGVSLRVFLLLFVVFVVLYWLGLVRGLSLLQTPLSLTKQRSLSLSYKPPPCPPLEASVREQLLFLCFNQPKTIWRERGGLGVQRNISSSSNNNRDKLLLHDAAESGGQTKSLSRLQGFSILLNPDAATSEQQLEKMYANATRQFARLFAESGVQKELRLRCRYTRRVTRGEGGRREVLRRRLQARMLLRQQKETGSNIQWHEPLQLNARQLQLLIKAMKSNACLEQAKTDDEEGETSR